MIFVQLPGIKNFPYGLNLCGSDEYEEGYKLLAS